MHCPYCGETNLFINKSAENQLIGYDCQHCCAELGIDEPVLSLEDRLSHYIRDLKIRAEELSRNNMDTLFLNNIIEELENVQGNTTKIS